jgi:hypothetical protein
MQKSITGSKPAQQKHLQDPISMEKSCGWWYKPVIPATAESVK